MDVSVVTPSFNMLGYLRRCAASVADQEGVAVEHLVMDGGSKDGTAAWLAAHPTVAGVSEPDKGMYDAVNKGFRRAKGEIVTHLNCDEQYLPGALAYVKEYFEQHPEVDVLFGDALLIRPDGSLIAYRKSFKPLLPLVLANPLYLFTAAMFIRRRVFENGELYDMNFKDIGDVEFIARLLRKGYRLEHAPRYLSVFTMTGANRGTFGSEVGPEARAFDRQAPWWVRNLKPFWRGLAWAIKLWSGAYRQGGPIGYAVYASDDALQRTEFVVEKASFRWRVA